MGNDYEGVCIIRNFAYDRDFYVFRHHLYKTHLESFNLTQKFRYHANKTFSSDLCHIGTEMSYSHDIETFDRARIARNMYYIYDFDTHKNISHKRSVLFHRYPCS